MAETRIALWPDQFGQAERDLLHVGGMSVTAFRYPTGVAALRVRDGDDAVVVLPFRGMQVWDARLGGRRLTMGSPFDMPRETEDYLASYGAFLIHCGITAMGNPGPGDTHPLHGELPSCRIDVVEIVTGEDGEGVWIDLVGRTRQSRAFHHDYDAVLTTRMRPKSAMIATRIDITNRSARPLDLMYLAHVNFRPVDGGVIVDSVPDGQLAIRGRPGDGDLPKQSARSRVLATPALHRHVVAREAVDPEIVLTMPSLADADGWMHVLQVHPDGRADIVSHRPDQLPCCVRWFVRDGDMDALGFSLPATGAPDGLAATRARGETVSVAGGGSWHAEVRAGAIDRGAAAAMQARIQALRDAAEGVRA